MKQTLKYALFTVLGMAVVAPAMAQNFPDVPENHWAYEALDSLKREGILVGYPDGLFRGPRNATRYELAIAIHATYKKLMGITNGLSEQIKALEEKIDGTGEPGDLKGLRDQLAALQSQVDGMKGWGDEVAGLKKLAEKFEKELASLGVDVAALQKDLTDIEKRLTAVEKRSFAVDISGDASLLVIAGNSRDGFSGMNKEGRIVGVNENTLGAAGMTKDLNVYHEAAITLKGTNTEGPKWHATLVYGNVMGPGGYPDMASRPGGPYTNTTGEMYVDSLGVAFDTSLLGLPFSAEIGRIGVEVGPYLFKRPDTTYYFQNPRWDDGKWRMDGANVDFKFGAVDLAVFAGKNSMLSTVNGIDLNPKMFTDQVTGTPALIDTTLGAKLGVPIGNLGKVSAAYLYHDSNTPVLAGVPDRMNVYGGEGNFKFGNIAVNGGYAKSLLSRNTSSIGRDFMNQAAFANAGYEANNWGLMVEYRKIQQYFQAAGSWRRIGTFYNPTNIETFYGKAHLNPASGIVLSYEGEFGQTIEPTFGLAADTDIQSHNATLGYRLNENWMATVGYEDVKIEAIPGDIRQKWASLNLGYNLGANSTLRLGYEYGSVTNPIAWGAGAAGTYRGGQLTTQLTIRF